MAVRAVVARFLRSTRWAVALGSFLAVWCLLGTLVPQETSAPELARAWALAYPAAESVARPLGLHDAFAAPLFLVAVLWLTASTAACSWDRSARARRLIASMRGDAPGPAWFEGRAGTVAQATLPEAQAIERTGAALRAAGYRVRREGRVVAAHRGAWGAIGSPLFHWSLVALVAILLSGQLTRSEGLLVLPEGERVRDASASYAGRVDEGPFYRGHSGLELRATGFRPRTVVGGVDRGVSAVVGLWSGGTLLASRRVYPNAPLAYGTVLIHREKWGYAPRFSVETSRGSVLASQYAFVLETQVTSEGAGPAPLALRTASGETIIAVRLPGARAGRAARRVEIAVQAGAEPTAAPVTLGPGERTRLPGDLFLRYVKPGMYLRVAVADDWTVPLLYAAFVLVGVGLSIAVVVPVRRVWVLAEPVADGTRLRVVTAHSHRDPGHASVVAGVLRQSFGAVDVEEGQ